MFCGNCGNKLDDGAKFCPNCGAQLENTTLDSNSQAKAASSEEKGIVQSPSERIENNTTQEKNAWQYFCLAIKQYVHFNGRARRKEFWYFILFYEIFYFGLMVIDTITGLMLVPGTGVLSTLFSLAMFCPALGVYVRRMHDCNKAGPYFLIPIYGWFVLPCTAGNVGENRFGSDPKQIK